MSINCCGALTETQSARTRIHRSLHPSVEYITEPYTSTMITLLFLIFTTLAHMAASNKNAPHDRAVYVLFELKAFPTEVGTVTGYYGLLTDLVQSQPGFVSETPFVSIDQSFQQTLYVRFDNDNDMHAWKNLLVHLRIQAYARATGFVDYRLRIGHEVGDSDCESGGRNATATAAGKLLLLWQHPTPVEVNTSIPVSGSEETSITYGDVSDVIVDAATYVGANNTLRVSSWTDRGTAVKVRNALPRVDGDDVRLIQVERQYGKFEREEAPDDADICQNAAVANDTQTLESC